MQVPTIDLDLAKEVFQVHGVSVVRLAMAASAGACGCCGLQAAGTPVISRQVSDALSHRAWYSVAEKRCRRSWKWLRTRLWVERKRCAWRANLRRCICRSRRRVD